MTFAARPLSVVYRVVNPIPMTSITSSFGSGGSTTWELTFTRSGGLTFSSTDSGSGFNTILSDSWHIPATTNVGDGYWIRLTVTSGASPSGGDTDAVGSWVQLNAQRQWEWTRVFDGTTSATLTLEIASDSSGTTVVASKSGITLTLSKGP